MMADLATDSSDLEKGPTRADTFETLVTEAGSLQASSSYPPEASKSTPDGGDASSSTTSAEPPKAYEREKVPKLVDLKRYPEGHPRLAAQQARNHNGSIHRRFEVEGEWLISHREYQTTFASERLLQWCWKHPEACKRLSAGQRNEQEKGGDMEEYDRLVEDLERSWLRYQTLLTTQKENRTLLSVHREEARGLYGSFLASQGMTDGDAFAPGYAAATDFCTTAAHQTHLPVRGVLYGPLGTALSPSLARLFGDEDSSSGGGGFLLPQALLARVLEMFQVFFSSGLLLGPVGVLMFGGLGRRDMFAVVVASVFVFSAVVVLGREAAAGGGGGGAGGGASGRGNGLLHGVVAAYTAVLATFLAQLGN